MPEQGIQTIYYKTSHRQLIISMKNYPHASSNEYLYSLEFIHEYLYSQLYFQILLKVKNIMKNVCKQNVSSNKNHKRTQLPCMKVYILHILYI